MSPAAVLREVLASIVVFLVALPLCMGIAVASGVPPEMGLVSGVIGGLIVGPLAGSPLQVSGPAAGLAVLCFEIVERHGLAGLSAAALVAGLVQIAAGRLRLGNWFRAVAPAVIYGMLAGIGVLIFASQLHVMVDDEPAASGLVNLVTLPRAALKALVDPVHQPAAAIGLLTLAVLIGWTWLKPRLPLALRVVPAPLLAVAAAMAAAAALELPVRYVTVPHDPSGFVRLLGLDALSLLLGPALLAEAIALAAVASAESMLCANAVDKLHLGARSDLDKELVAQGVGNAVAGLVGALPVTGVIVRSTANLDAGATTRWPAVLHGGWLLGVVVFLPQVLAMVPVASLAAVLVYIGIQLVKPHTMRHLAAEGRAEVAIYVVTVVAIVATSLLEGLLVGFVLAVLKVAWTFSNLEVDVVERDDSDVVEVHLRGAATFVRLPYLVQALEGVPEGRPVVLELEHLTYIDHACMDAIADWDRLRRSAHPDSGSLEDPTLFWPREGLPRTGPVAPGRTRDDGYDRPRGGA